MTRQFPGMGYYKYKCRRSGTLNKYGAKFTRNLAILFLLSTGTLLSLQPLSALSQSPVESDKKVDLTTVELSNCYLNPDMQSRPAADMNTITSDSIVKTVYVEKETYVCKTPSIQTVLADIHVYAQMIDNIQNQSSISRRIEVVSCLKDVNATEVKCVSEKAPNNFLPSEIGCSITSPFQRPILMNTVAGSGNLSHLDKTIEADSKVFSCRDASNARFVKNLVTFTELYENLDKMDLKLGGESMMCMKKIVDLTILGCYFEKIM